MYVLCVVHWVLETRSVAVENTNERETVKKLSLKIQSRFNTGIHSQPNTIFKLLVAYNYSDGI